jgi:hypothetical protein
MYNNRGNAPEALRSAEIRVFVSCHRGSLVAFGFQGPGLNFRTTKYSRTRLQRHRFMQHLIHSVIYSVVPINSSLLTITLLCSVITTLIYNDDKYSVLFMTL